MFTRFNIITGSPWKVLVMAAGGAVSGGGNPNSTGSVVGDSTRLVPARVPAVFEVVAAPGSGAFTKNEVRLFKPYTVVNFYNPNNVNFHDIIQIGVNVVAPSKRLVPSRVTETPGKSSGFQIEFIPEEVGTHIIEVCSSRNFI